MCSDGLSSIRLADGRTVDETADDIRRTIEMMNRVAARMDKILNDRPKDAVFFGSPLVPCGLAGQLFDEEEKK